MLKRIHEHIIGELNQGARTDTIFVITGIVFNLIILAVNSAIASEDENNSQVILMIIFSTLIFIFNFIAINGLLVGRNTRNRLLSGLIQMYKDNDVDRYYDPVLLSNYNKRYILFTSVIVCLGLTALIVPPIIKILN